jgi:hypothetical protein
VAPSTAPPRAPLDSLEVNERELRECSTPPEFRHWVEHVRNDKSAPCTQPAQYLHAWNDSTTRVIRFCAHRDLVGAPDGDLAGLLARHMSAGTRMRTDDAARPGFSDTGTRINAEGAIS